MKVSPRSRASSQRMLEGVVEVVAPQHDLAAEVEHGLHLDVRRGLRHHDHRGDATTARRERDALGMVAGGGADHAAACDLVVDAGNLVVGAAELERKDRLQVFALEQDVVAEAATQAPGRLERRFDGDVVDARLEDAFDVTFLHGGNLRSTAYVNILRR